MKKKQIPHHHDCDQISEEDEKDCLMFHGVKKDSMEEETAGNLVNDDDDGAGDHHDDGAGGDYEDTVGDDYDNDDVYDVGSR